MIADRSIFGAQVVRRENRIQAITISYCYCGHSEYFSILHVCVGELSSIILYYILIVIYFTLSTPIYYRSHRYRCKKCGNAYTIIIIVCCITRNSVRLSKNRWMSIQYEMSFVHAYMAATSMMALDSTFCVFVL